MSNPQVPLTIRNSLNVESGLNDGIATPIVTVLIAVVAAEEGATQGWFADAVKNVGVAVVVGLPPGGRRRLARGAGAQGRLDVSDAPSSSSCSLSPSSATPRR